jgi:hypothetical protein
MSSAAPPNIQTEIQPEIFIPERFSETEDLVETDFGDCVHAVNLLEEQGRQDEALALFNRMHASWWLNKTMLETLFYSERAVNEAVGDAEQEKANRKNDLLKVVRKYADAEVRSSHGIGERYFMLPDGRVVSGDFERYLASYQYAEGLLRP